MIPVLASFPLPPSLDIDLPYCTAVLWSRMAVQDNRKENRTKCVWVSTVGWCLMTNVETSCTAWKFISLRECYDMHKTVKREKHQEVNLTLYSKGLIMLFNSTYRWVRSRRPRKAFLEMVSILFPSMNLRRNSSIIKMNFLCLVALKNDIGMVSE